MNKEYHIAVVGASGVVGRTIIEVLEEHELPISNLQLFASARSAGKTIPFRGEDIVIEELTEESLQSPIQIAIFSAGGDTSKKYAPIAAANGVTVIDNSSAFRMDENKKLIVPEINGKILTTEDKIIANPNCSTIQSVLPIAVIHDKYSIERIVYSTYQAVSGAGQAGISDLENGTTENFQYPIVETVIPQIDVFQDNGYTKEEEKMINETHKILGDTNIGVTATCVRVPIKTSHAVSINIQTTKSFDIDEIREFLANTPGITVIDDIENNRYPLQHEAAGKDDVFVGRIRRDHSIENGLNLFVVSDNLRKGAATNSVQIAEQLIALDLV
ncbi:aspartate-semialdehyde dehydrogenase [Aerococcaceae bacterium DSM 111020]|nr:aspartate-semialdehyde dehydrogenase [Aerococcaceae bacterium DSM 111020]